MESSFSSRLVDGCEHTNEGGLDCWGIKAECEGRVHTPALTEQCPVAGEPQVLYALHNWANYIRPSVCHAFKNLNFLRASSLGCLRKKKRFFFSRK